MGSSVVVWVLVVVLNGVGGSISRAPLVVDNIASRENCVGLGQVLTDRIGSASGYTCAPVRKVKVD